MKLTKQEFLAIITKEELQALYKIKSANAIANMYNTHADYVIQALEFYGIPKKVKKRELLICLGKENLETLYETNSALAIAKMYNISAQFVYEALDYFEIPRKSMSEIHNMNSVMSKFKSAIVKKNGDKDLTHFMSANELAQLYEMNTILDIATLFGVSRKDVSCALEACNIKKRSLSEVHSFPKTLAKQEATCRDKYGTSNYAKTSMFKDNYYQNMHVTKAKEFATKKARGTFSTSGPEIQFYNFLCEQYGTEDVERQYKDKRYPYACDFYVKSEDLFIELNLHWTHGTHVFNENSQEDLTKLAKWQEKAKTSKFYQTAINVWTLRDPMKLKTAKDNNLNYQVYYNYN